MDKPAPLLTAAEMARRLNISVETAYQKCRTGAWPHTRIGRLYRFTEEHYQAIIAPPVRPGVRPRTQRGRIDLLLRALDEA